MKYILISILCLIGLSAALASVHYSSPSTGILNVKDYGAVGDFDPETGTGTDDTAAIQAAFDSLVTHSITAPAEHMRYALNDNRNIYFPKGAYKITSALQLGDDTDTDRLYHVTFNFDQACLFGVLDDTDDFVLEVDDIRGCTFNGLQIISDGNGLRIDDAKNNVFNELNIGASGLYCLKFEGTIFNNKFDSLHFLQNITWSSNEAYALYFADTLFTVNNFSNVHMAAGEKAVYLKGAINCVFDTIECEGWQGSPAWYMEDCHRITINNLYLEALDAQDDIAFHLKDCERISMNEFVTGNHRYYSKFEDCNSLYIRNWAGLGYPYLVADVNGLILDNFEYRAQRSVELLSGPDDTMDDATTPYTALDFVSMRNVRCESHSGETLRAWFNVETGALDTSANMLENPWGRTADGDVTATYCTVAQDGSYTDISPLGYEESLVTVTADTDYPFMTFTIDANMIDAEEMRATLIVAFKWNPETSATSGVTRICSAGANLATLSSDDANIGTFEIYKDDWLLSATRMLLTDSTTTIKVVWNHPTPIDAGDEYLFGGACLTRGGTLKFP